MNKFFLYFNILFLYLSLAACQSGNVESGDFSKGQIEAIKKAEYKIGPGDQLRVIVFGEEELTGEYLVSNTGFISLPFVEEVDVNGLSLKEIRQKIQAELSNGFLKNPNVSIEILNYRPYYILGEINKPGEYPYSSDALTVLKAVAIAEGYTTRADTRRVRIKHENESVEKEYSLTSDVPVQPGDRILILERYF